MLTTVTTALASSPAPNLPGFLNVVGTYLERYGYWSILLLVTLEDFGIPVPGETILIAAAIFAGAGRLNVVAVGAVGFVAAVIGDNIGFAIGHFGGRALALRWGRYVFLTEERLAKAEVFFNRHGGKIIVVARFIEGLRQANGIIAGISGMRWLRFVVFNMLGAALWVGTWVSLGYLAGNHIGTVYGYITRYSYYLLIVAAVLLAAYLTRRVLRRRQRAGEQAGEHKALEPQASLEIQGSSVAQEGSSAIERSVVQESSRSQVMIDAPDSQEGRRLRENIAAGRHEPQESSVIPRNSAAAERGESQESSVIPRKGAAAERGESQESSVIGENIAAAERGEPEPSSVIAENAGTAGRGEPEGSRGIKQGPGTQGL